MRQLLYRARGKLRAAATAITPYSLLLRADGGENLVLAAAGGAVVAKAGAALATTVAIGAVGLSIGGGEPLATARDGVERPRAITLSPASPAAGQGDGPSRSAGRRSPPQSRREPGRAGRGERGRAESRWAPGLRVSDPRPGRRLGGDEQAVRRLARGDDDSAGGGGESAE